MTDKGLIFTISTASVLGVILFTAAVLDHPHNNIHADESCYRYKSQTLVIVSYSTLDNCNYEVDVMIKSGFHIAAVTPQVNGDYGEIYLTTK